MTDHKPTARRLVATVDEVWVSSGLAFLRDDEDHEWTVTRSTPGAALAEMQPGQKWQVEIAEYPDFALAARVAPQPH